MIVVFSFEAMNCDDSSLATANLDYGGVVPFTYVQQPTQQLPADSMDNVAICCCNYNNCSNDNICCVETMLAVYEKTAQAVGVLANSIGKLFSGKEKEDSK